jgi:carbon monoxide dehydrogenase subunit G
VVRVEFTIEIARPPAEVFEYLADLEKLPEWQESAIESRVDGSLAKGSRITECRRLFGRDVETALEVTAYEPPARLTLRSLDGPVRFTVDHRLEEAGGATLLHFAGEAKPGGILRLAGPVVESKARQEFRRDFDRLKEILERV